MNNSRVYFADQLEFVLAVFLDRIVASQLVRVVTKRHLVVSLLDLGQRATLLNPEYGIEAIGAEMLAAFVE